MIATPVLIAHIAAGAIGILTGVVAISVRKSEFVHRAFVTASLAPLMVMIYWLVRIRFRFRPDAVPLSQGES